ncbi:MFS transporter [Nocardia sp. NPDC051750]|uniref:MFS transporter n=1 Tax=Nocardia sp. NPDC051750 TaxID=3364325 RepID=UPI0037A0DFE8
MTGTGGRKHSLGAVRAAIRASPGAVRLTLVRFTSQFGDGMFQAALSGAILFNPERETDPLAVAAGFAVLLLPYSVIGPYAGALLDRWDRRLVLLFANIMRGILIAAVALGLLAGVGANPLLLLALAVVGISRFTAAGVSAALPRVLAQRWLVPANSVLATAGSACAAVGAAAAVALIGLVGAGDTGSAVAVAVSAAGSVAGVVLAAGFRPRTLGPESTAGQAVGAFHAVLTGLVVGARAVRQSADVSTAMIGIGTHRIVFGANTLIMVLVLRESPSGGTTVEGGLIGFGVAITATAAGMLVAALLTPFLIPRLGRPRTVLLGLSCAIAVQLALVLPTALADSPDATHRAHQLLLAGAFLFGLAGQTIKLTGDAAMQIDIADDRRGQVFALQDTVFNIAFVLAVALTAVVVPADGRSVAVVLAGAGCYAAGIVALLANNRRSRGRSRASRI